MGLLTADEVAERLRVSRRCVHNWAQRRRIGGAYKVNGRWRFDEGEFVRWFRGRQWQTFTDGERPIGGASASTVENYATHYEQMIGRKPKSA